MSSETYHEPFELLSSSAKELHRALVSLGEELDAIDWYHQRADVCGDAELKAVLLHNRGEEIEHGMMVLEWIRRHDAQFDEHMRTYLFSELPITEIEAADQEKSGSDKGAGESSGSGTKAGSGGPAAATALGIGSLKDTKATSTAKAAKGRVAP